MAFKDIAKLRTDLHEKVEELRALQTEIENREDPTATEEEKEKSRSLREEICNREEEIATTEILQRNDTLAKEKEERERKIEESGFRNLGDFVQAVFFRKLDRLGITEERDMIMGDGPSAGFLVPEVFGGMLRAFDPYALLVRPRAMPMGGGNDATVTFNAFDQSGSRGVYGGVTVQYINETAAVPDAGDLKFRQVKMEPQPVAGYMDVSKKLMNNASEITGYIERQLSLAIRKAEESRFISGNGVGCPLGFIGHASSIEIDRNTALDVKYADLTAMYCATPYSANLVWGISPSAKVKLLNMVDAANQPIWQPNARDGLPSTILGVPVVYTDELPVLGTKGDVCLLDLSYYGIREGSPMTLFTDPYTQGGNQLTRIYIFWNIDGQPLLTSPLLLEDGSTTVSPFVILK